MQSRRSVTRFFSHFSMPPARVSRLLRLTITLSVVAVATIVLGLSSWLQPLHLLPWQTGDLSCVHGRLAVLAFLGLSSSGFTLLAGPALLGLQPSRSWLQPLAPLIFGLGFALTLVTESVFLVSLGNLLMSSLFLGTGWFIWRLGKGRQAGHFWQATLPMSVGNLILVAAPWLPVHRPEIALWLLWCGPIPVASAALYHLILHRLGGQKITNVSARIFQFALLSGWFFSLLVLGTTLRGDPGPFALFLWRLAGGSWFLFLISLALGSGMWRAVIKGKDRSGLGAIVVMALLPSRLGAIVLAVRGRINADALVHLLGMGSLTLLLLGLGAFWLDQVPEQSRPPFRYHAWLASAWLFLSLARTVSAFGWIDPFWIPGASAAILLLLSVWMTLILKGVFAGHRQPLAGCRETDRIP